MSGIGSAVRTLAEPWVRFEAPWRRPRKVTVLRRGGPAPGERARAWQRMLDEGVYGSRAALARGERVSRAAVTKALRRWGVEA